MKNLIRIIIIAGALSAFALHAQQSPEKASDTSPHKVRFVTVDKDVKLEVLDWGGSGRPLIFLAGGGRDACESFKTKYLRGSSMVRILHY